MSLSARTLSGGGPARPIRVAARTPGVGPSGSPAKRPAEWGVAFARTYHIK